LSEFRSAENSAATAKQTFYRKNFSRAKGIINEVREISDSVSGLADACGFVAEGTQDLEQVSRLYCHLKMVGLWVVVQTFDFLSLCCRSCRTRQVYAKPWPSL
jgi:hypothetical protein